MPSGATGITCYCPNRNISHVNNRKRTQARGSPIPKPAAHLRTVYSMAAAPKQAEYMRLPQPQNSNLAWRCNTGTQMGHSQLSSATPYWSVALSAPADSIDAAAAHTHPHTHTHTTQLASNTPARDSLPSTHTEAHIQKQNNANKSCASTYGHHRSATSQTAARPGNVNSH